MVVVRIIVKIVLLPVRICLTMIQLVVMFFTWLSATVFHILSGIICITAVLGYGFGQETGTEAVRMLVAGFILYIDGMKESAKTFEGIHQMLEELKEKGYKLAICSNASKWELDVILRKLEVNDYFDVIQGVTEKNNKKYSLEELLLREKPELAIMVGDRSYDKEAARYNQIPFVGCKYGYGKPEELSDCKYSVETALELSRIIDEIISARGGAD